MTEPTEAQVKQMLDLAEMMNEELHPDLQAWVEEGSFGLMLRHPLVYQVPLHNKGLANRAYREKHNAIGKAMDQQDWSQVIWLHERPHRLNALIEYVTGRNEFGEVLPVMPANQDVLDLVADVWVDSENIEQNEEEWRALFANGANGLWLGTEHERAEFDALPDPIRTFRGGTVGDWSWTTRSDIAEFFSRRSGYPVRTALIPKADVFGYLTRRGEAELLVRLTPEREPLVYPNRFQKPGE